MSATANPKELVFVKLLLPYSIGVMLAMWLPPAQVLWPMGIVLLLLSTLLFVVHLKHRDLKDPFTRHWAVILFGWLVYVGLLNSVWSNPIVSPQHYGHTAHVPGVVLLQVDDVPLEKGSNYQVIAKVIGSFKGGSPYPECGKVMLQLPIDSLASTLAYGEVVAVNARFEPIPPPQNPYEFNYSNYLANKHIHHQLHPKANRWYKTGHNQGHWFYNRIFNIRARALEILQAHLPDPELYGVASAMLLGYRGALTPEVRQRYTITGSMHVLAVSGMHVGYLFIILGGLLLPMKYLKLVWLRLAILLLIIWLYAALTGFSPSVLRASVMFSLFAVGKTINRQSNSINLLAASALLILLWEPRQLLDVGFQLSYLAVLGIIFFYKPLTDLWPIHNKGLRWFWQGTCVSVAAQVATLPLVLYYFHQIPLYALLANLGMLMLAPWVMVSGLATLVLHCVPDLGRLTGNILWLGLWLMDEMLTFIAILPNAVWKAIYPTVIEASLLFGLLISIIAVTRMRATKPLIAAGCFLFVYLGVINARLYEQRHQQGLIVYQYPTHTAIATINGLDANLWVDDLALADTTKMERSIYPYLHARGCRLPLIKLLGTTKSNQYGMVGTKRFMLLTTYSRRNLPREKLTVDFLIIAHNPAIDMQQLHWVYSAGHIIFDGSNKAAAAERWMKECKVLGIDCHNTRDEAFIANW